MKIRRGKYKGWNVLTLLNKWIKIHVTPSLGGRIIQYNMNGYEYLFNNPHLTGLEPDHTRLGEDGKWLNYGGEKIWPAPQGWDSSEQWPGPPDPILDSGVYTIIANDNPSELKKFTLVSPVDHRTGLQVLKEIYLEKNGSVAIVNASFMNRDNIPRRWSIWPVIQMAIQSDCVDNRYRIICPVNPKSMFKDGFKVMHGLVNNPQLGIDKYGNLIVNYQYLTSKIGLDSSAGWIAFLDTETDKIFILLYEHENDKLYPENTDAQIWTQGRGIIYSRNKITEFLNDRFLNPPYMEMEILSPIWEIKPGESKQFEYKMCSTTILSGYDTILKVNEYGVIIFPAILDIMEESICIEAGYGVFHEGKLKMLYETPELISKTETIIYEQEVSPLEGISIKINIRNKWTFDKDACISVRIYTHNNDLLGEIDNINLNSEK